MQVKFKTGHTVSHVWICHRSHTDLGPDETAGWYWAYSFPGCMPDSDFYGPYDTEKAARDAARKEHIEDYGECDQDDDQ